MSYIYKYINNYLQIFHHIVYDNRVSYIRIVIRNSLNNFVSINNIMQRIIAYYYISVPNESFENNKNTVRTNKSRVFKRYFQVWNESWSYFRIFRLIRATRIT